MSILDHVGLGSLDPHHDLDKAGNKISGTASQAANKINETVNSAVNKIKHEANDAEKQVKNTFNDIEHRIKKVTHDAEHGLHSVANTVEHEVGEKLERVAHEAKDELEKLVHAALEEFEREIEKIGTRAVGKLIEFALKIAHHAIPDKPQVIRISAFKLDWERLDDRFDALLHYVQHPPEDGHQILDLVQRRSPDYIIISLEGGPVALVVSSSIAGGGIKIPVPVQKPEAVAAEVAHHFEA